MRNLMLILLSVGLGATGQILFKAGMRKFGATSVTSIWSQLFDIITVPQIFLGFLCFGISSVLWLTVISKNELSFAYPLVSLSYVIIFVFSVVLFRENVSPVRLAGLVSICLGVILITRS